MKSNKQRRQEIKARRHQRAMAMNTAKPGQRTQAVSADAVPADPAKLTHNNTYGLLPRFYLDRPFVCRDCSAEAVWTGTQQKWWYEELQKPIASQAVRCLDCRRARRQLVEASGDAALRLRCEVQALRALGDREPTPNARASAEAALHSKWDGLRVTAVKVLCRWSDVESLRKASEAAMRECAEGRRTDAGHAMNKVLAMRRA
ncbi:zinc-ribbon domain-containing protein [Inhella proteolytica]|uniref:Zinc-ribbon domain-containing protein n=1 Tax=Inhella proteolytica TaxID=2795029 RepID=A0A931NGG3_9BURK|nr:zinc-ribbon domain-containing protein [Inhella proteolytica]MBH9576678.1 zinc-ribbon domain-containing protein [Inhella proteolytica]